MKIVTISLVLLCACNEGQFKGFNDASVKDESSNTTQSEEANPEVDEKSDQTGASKKKDHSENEEYFDLNASTKEKLDLVWVVDNSSSMVDSMDQIKANFMNFLQKLDTALDVQVMSISKITYPLFNVLFPKISHAKLTQIDIAVNSFDPMLIGAAASCPAALSANTKICDQREDSSKVVNSTSNSWLNNSNARLVYGAASAWFRSDARRVYVFVTDDDSILLKASAFQAAMTKAGSFKSYSVFSFRGIQGQSPCADSAGTQYELLEQASGGGAFNICTPDWSPTFDRLLQTLTVTSPASWTLKRAPVAARVSLNGKLLNETEFKIEGRQLTLTLPLDRSQVYKVKIVYK